MSLFVIGDTHLSLSCEDPCLHAEFAAGIGEFADDVPFSVLIGGVFDRVFGVFTGPQAKAVVVFGGEDGDLKTCVLELLDPLSAIQFGGIEAGGGIGAAPPFPIAEGIHAEVQKGGKLSPIPFQLAVVGEGKRMEVDHGRSPFLFFLHCK